MPVIVQSRIILDCFVIQCDQVLSCALIHLLLHLLLELFNSRQNRVNLHVFDSMLGHLRFQDHPLLLVLFLYCDSFTFQVLHYHRNAVIRVLIHQHVEYPWFTILDPAPVHSDLIICCQAMINFL